MAAEFPGLCHILKEAGGRAGCVAFHLGKAELLAAPNAGVQPGDAQLVPAQDPEFRCLPSPSQLSLGAGCPGRNFLVYLKSQLWINSP